MISKFLLTGLILTGAIVAPVAAQTPTIEEYQATVTTLISQCDGTTPVLYTVCFDPTLGSNGAFTITKEESNGAAPTAVVMTYADGSGTTTTALPASADPKTRLIIELVIDDLTPGGTGRHITIDASALTRNNCTGTRPARIVIRGELGDNDNIYKGGDADDIIVGGEGKDTIQGRRGKDTIFGGRNDDVISGGGNSDTLFGEEGEDEIHGGWGRDTIDGGDGWYDVLYGEGGSDDISDPDGALIINGGSGDDDISVRLDDSHCTFPYADPQGVMGIVEGAGDTDRIWIATPYPGFVLGGEIYEDVHTSQQPYLAGNIQGDPLAPIGSLLKLTYVGKDGNNNPIVGNYWTSTDPNGAQDGALQLRAITGHRFYLHQVAKLAPYAHVQERSLPFFNPQPVAFGPADAWTYYPEEANRAARVRLTNGDDHLAIGSFKEGGGQLGTQGGTATPFNPNGSNPGFRQAVFFPANNYAAASNEDLALIRDNPSLKLEVDLDGDGQITTNDEKNWFAYFDDFVKDQVDAGADMSTFSGMVPVTSAPWNGNSVQIQVPMLNGVPLISWTGGASHVLHDVHGTDFTALGLTLDVHLLYGYTPVIRARKGNDVIDARYVNDLRTNNPGSPYNPSTINLTDNEVGERLGMKIHGDNGFDLIMGSRNADRIYGGRGRDQIFGHIGDDVLHGGCDNDLVNGGPGADRINGGRGHHDFLVGDHWDVSGPFDQRSGARGTGNGIFNNNGQLKATPDMTDRIHDGDGVLAVFSDSDTSNSGHSSATWLHAANALGDNNNPVLGAGARDHVSIRFSRNWMSDLGRTFGGTVDVDGLPLDFALIQLGNGADTLKLRAPRTCANAPLPTPLFISATGLTADAVYGVSTTVNTGENDRLIARYRASRWTTHAPYEFDISENASKFGFEQTRGTLSWK